VTVAAASMANASALIPFVPSGPDFEQALAFFAELGFAVQWRNAGLARLRFGAAAFMLQDIDVPEWQKNQMLTLEVDDLDAYWHDIAGKRLETRFAGVRLKEPTDFPWGREVNIIDPAGVCWHVRRAQIA
jgi:predicted enzyme related to lactoylglutathione lyase